mgnify:CR=1 FL=1
MSLYVACRDAKYYRLILIILLDLFMTLHNVFLELYQILYENLAATNYTDAIKLNNNVTAML